MRGAPLLLLAALAGCPTKPNPAYCDDGECGAGLVCQEHRCVPDTGGDGGVDGGCQAACADPTPWCAQGACVACLATEHCPSTAPMCGPSGACEPCIADVQCAGRADGAVTGLCTPAGECLRDDDVLLVDRDAACAADAAPFCQLQQAIDFAAAGGARDVVLMGASQDYEPVVITDQVVRIFGKAPPGGSLPAIRGASGENAVTVMGEGSDVELHRLRVRQASGGARGVYCFNAARCLVHRVTADSNSFGIYLDDTAVAEVTRSTIAGNNGGGIYLFRVDRQVTLVNNFIYRNGSSSSNAGGIYLDGAIGAAFGEWVVRSNSLFGNLSNAVLAAPGVHCSQPVMLSSIVLWGHAEPSTALDCALQYSSSETLRAGLENIEGDPRFVSTSPPEDLHLHPLSPCRNRGAPAPPPDDIDGDPRDVPPDIGADELTQ